MNTGQIIGIFCILSLGLITLWYIYVSKQLGVANKKLKELNGNYFELIQESADKMENQIVRENKLIVCIEDLLLGEKLSDQISAIIEWDDENESYEKILQELKIFDDDAKIHKEKDKISIECKGYMFPVSSKILLLGEEKYRQHIVNIRKPESKITESKITEK